MNKTKLYYSLPLVDRLGHLSTELFYLRNLYPIENYEYHIFIPRLADRPNTNLFMLKKVTEGMHVTETDNKDLLQIAYTSNSELARQISKDGNFILLDGGNLYNHFLSELNGQKPHFYYTLSKEEEMQGLALRKCFGIPDNAPVVTLHVRDRGFLPHFNYHSFRDANIENYLPAVEYLLSLGVYVVRIGDKSMKRIEGLPSNFIDAIHHPAYSHFVEPYFISSSLFHLGTISGPCSVAISFNKPILYTNVQLSLAEWGQPNDLFLPKKFYSYKLHRFLTYQEILNSPLINFWQTKEFEDYNISLVENSPIEIIEAVKEMILRLTGQYQNSKEIEDISALTKNIQKTIHEKRVRENLEPSIYAGYYSKQSLSHSFVRLNPWFLGHEMP